MTKDLDSLTWVLCPGICPTGASKALFGQKFFVTTEKRSQGLGF